MQIPIRWCVVVALISSVSGCTVRPSSRSPAVRLDLQRYEYVQGLMGLQVRLVLYTKDEPTAKTAAKAAFARVAELEEIMSDYQRDSELMQLCGKAGTGPVPVSKELFDVLAYAQHVSEASAGAFDVTVGPLVQLWRQSRKTQKLPDPLALATARSLVGHHLMQLDRKRQTVDLKLPGMRLDLGGIGKGYAGDEAIRVLQDHAVTSALFEAGGDIVVSAAPPDRPEGWLIETQDSKKFSLADAAVSTSGYTEQFVEIDGVPYSHVVDPRTGIGLTNHFAATVVARRGITTDALSTAATVLGPSRSRPLLKRFAARGWVRKVTRETTSRQSSTTSATNP
ncbi:MAG: FAD:protein transferase [Phycisphaerales bacterium]|nr:FAD:protein transferase [Phycisphaerales bacterium]